MKIKYPGIDRIKVLSSEIKDKSLLKIVDYLLTRQDMDDKFLNEEKSLRQMVEFIKSNAQKKAINGFVMIEDEVVFSWAIHYFDEPNEKLNLSNQNKDEYKNITVNDNITNKTKKSKCIPEGQLSLFDI